MRRAALRRRQRNHAISPETPTPRVGGLGTPRARHASLMNIRIHVSGEIPPAKGEAKSMLSQAHTQHRRVRRLLEEAAAVMRDRELFVGDVCLDVTVTARRRDRLPDATNMLGGIADVLQARTTGADVAYLGPLASVACFHDDAQIREIHYRRLEGDLLGYRVVIRPLTQ